MKLRLLAIACLAFLSALSAPAAPKPNIIFTLSDDVELGNIGCYGGHFKTPNIDALAAGGTRFEHCYANPVCGPSRAICLTGRYVFRTGMLTNGYTDRMRKEEIMVPKVLKPAGYVTASVGKWDQLPLQPSDWGFDKCLRFESSGKYWSTQVKTYMQNGKEVELGDRYLPFKELAVAADTSDPEAKAGREKLQAVMKEKGKKKREQAAPPATATTTAP